jgi:hypothetical protein
VVQQSVRSSSCVNWDGLTVVLLGMWGLVFVRPCVSVARCAAGFLGDTRHRVLNFVSTGSDSSARLCLRAERLCAKNVGPKVNELLKNTLLSRCKNEPWPWQWQWSRKANRTVKYLSPVTKVFRL